MEINIDHVAALAKLRLTPEEKKLFSSQLPSILEYVSRLQEVDTSHVDAKAYLTDATNVFRADEPTSAVEEREAVVAGFPKKKHDALEVPGVFTE